MSQRSTDVLVAELVSDLEPVSRVPQLRIPAFGLLAGWMSLAATVSIWPGAQSVGTPDFLPLFLGIGVFASGGLCSALALCIPGRERTARIGYALCGVGAACVAGVALTRHATFPSASLSYLAAQTMHDWICVGLATIFAVPFLALVLRFGRSAWVLRHWVVSAYAGIGSVSCGAMLVHAICAERCAEHALGSHALAPIWGAPLLLIPAYLALRRRSLLPRRVP